MSPAITTPVAPAANRSVVPPEIVDLIGKPIMRGDYQGTESSTWRTSFLGKKVTSTRETAFSNEFQILTDGDDKRPLMWQAGTTLNDAIATARDISRASSRPDYIGPSLPGVGVGVLQAKDGAFLAAYIGIPHKITLGDHVFTSEWKWSDRFGGDIHGRSQYASDARAVSKWTAPVDKHGKVVDGVAPPADSTPVGIVGEPRSERLTALTPLLKFIVDEEKVYTPTSQA